MPLTIAQLLFAAVLLYLTSQPIELTSKSEVVQKEPSLIINIPMTTIANASANVQASSGIRSSKSSTIDSYTN